MGRPSETSLGLLSDDALKKMALLSLMPVESGSAPRAGTAACILLYGICWLLYYLGKTGKAVLLGLAVFPCTAFLLYSWERKNYIAAVFAGAFSVCHLIYAFVNFVLRAEP